MEQIKQPLYKSMWKNRISYLFLLPALLLLMTFQVIPLVKSFKYSLYQWDGILPATYVGFENFVQLFQDETFLISLKNNLLFTVLTTFFTVALGFLFAVAIERRVKGWSIFKFTYFLPVMISMTVVGMLFSKIMEPSFGMLNALLGALGLESWQQAWLGDPKLVMYSVIAVTIWQYSGFTMLLILAALEGISPEIHDAATIDGVTPIRRIFSIIFPIIRRIVYIVTMLQIIFSFKVFDITWVMTGGGPGTSSEMLGTFLYKTAFRSNEFGYASSIAVSMTLIILVISLVYLSLTRLSVQDKE